MENNTITSKFEVLLDHPNSTETVWVLANTKAEAIKLAEAKATEPGSKAVWVCRHD